MNILIFCYKIFLTRTTSNVFRDLKLIFISFHKHSFDGVRKGLFRKFNLFFYIA